MENIYQTSQFGEIVYLKANKIEHIKLERDKSDPNKIIFYFKDSDERKVLTENYYNHKGLVNDALAFVDEIRHVKSLMYNFNNKKQNRAG